MHTLALDPWMGASGDMLLGVLLDLGADESRLEPIEAALSVDYTVNTETLAGVTATDVFVKTSGGDDHRTPPEVIDEIESIDLDQSIREDAIAVVQRLAEAEASVHGSTAEEVHFHAVGADDAIADICGVVTLLADLSMDNLVTTPVATGSGTVETSHGVYPIPPPAVTAIAETADWSIHPGSADGELLTPTGAALLAELAAGIQRLPPMDLDTTGYGTGDRRYPDRPNVLRGLLGTTTGRLTTEDVVLLETIVDDVTPETIGALQETLPEVGALDVAAIPATMKQSRPGQLIQVIVTEADADRVARRLAEETGTLGVREHPLQHRFVAEREIETVELELDNRTYEVSVKVAMDDAGRIYDVSAEDADARRVATDSNLPVREIRRLAEQAFRREP